MMKHNVLIVYEDSREELAIAANALKGGFSAAGCKAKIREASEASLPEMLAASVFVFGIATKNHESYAELKRFLCGVNLSGRHAAVFGSDDRALVESVAAMVKDTELQLYDKAFHPGDERNVAAWMEGFKRIIDTARR